MERTVYCSVHGGKIRVLVPDSILGVCVKFGPCSAQQQLVSAEAVVGETVVNVENDDEEVHLCLFGISISVELIYAFLYYKLFSDNVDILKGIITQPARPDALVTTVITCLAQRGEPHGR